MRIIPYLRAISAAEAPLLAVCFFDEDTVSCHRPVIMKRPYNRYSKIHKAPEKHTLIHPVSVQIVYMHEVWTVLTKSS